MPKRILFFRIWSDPPIAVSVARMLASHFSDFQIEIIDVWRLIKKDRRIIFLNLFHVICEYWSDLLFKGMKPRTAFYRTTYLFRYVKDMALKIISPAEDITFTFQLQSLFDMSFPGIPNFIYTDHTHLANQWYSEMDSRKLLDGKWIGLERSIYTNAALIFTRSHNISKSLVEQYEIPAEKIKCVFAGGNTKVSKNTSFDKDYLNQTILFIGMDWQRKGGPALVNAFSRICNKYPKALLKIIGCDPVINHPQIKVLGKLPVDQLAAHYESASIFCVPSINEPFGVVFVEAMAFALPIVATLTGAIPEMVKDGWNGYLVKPGDVNALSTALEILLSNPEQCKKFGSNGKLLVNKVYNWDSVGEKIRKAITDYLKDNF